MLLSKEITSVYDIKVMLLMI